MDNYEELGSANQICGGPKCELMETTIEFCTKSECHLQEMLDRQQARIYERRSRNGTS